MPRRKSAERNRRDLDIITEVLLNNHSISNILDSLARVMEPSIERCRRLYGETDKATLKRTSQLDALRVAAIEIRKRGQS